MLFVLECMMPRHHTVHVLIYICKIKFKTWGKRRKVFDFSDKQELKGNGGGMLKIQITSSEFHIFSSIRSNSFWESWTKEFETDQGSSQWIVENSPVIQKQTEKHEVGETFARLCKIYLESCRWATLCSPSELRCWLYLCFLSARRPWQ